MGGMLIALAFLVLALAMVFLGANKAEALATVVAWLVMTVGVWLMIGG